MSEAAEEVLLREGLAAWGRGDVDALERLLDPDVTLRAMRPGPWDCDGREQVMDLMRLRAGQKRRDPAAEVTVQRMDQSTFLGAGMGGSQGIAILVRVAAGRVVSLQQISSEPHDPVAEAAVSAVRSGDVDALVHVLTGSPHLARVARAGYQGRTLLHVATDWPGYLPNLTGLQSSGP